MVLGIPPYEPMAMTTPFTTRDNLSYLEKVNLIRAKLNEHIGNTSVTYQDLVNRLNDDFASLNIQWNDELLTVRNEVISQLGIPGTPSYDAIVTTVGDVTDPATAALVTGSTATRTALDSVYGDNATAALVEGATATRTALDGAYGDAATATLVAGATETRTALDAAYGDVATADLVTGASDTRAALDSTYASQGLPSWGRTGVKAFDRERGLYNCNARTLARFRTARASALAGVAPVHIAVLGDSTTHRATDVDNANIVSWPARMRDFLIRNLGTPNAGSGIIHLWNVVNENVTEPRVVRQTAGAGVVSTASFGPYAQSGAQVYTDTLDNGRIDFTPGVMTDTFYAYMLSSGSRTRVVISDGTDTFKYEMASYYGESFTPSAGYTAVNVLDGYVRATPATNGGIRVSKFTVPRRSGWTMSIRSMPSDVTYPMAVESRDSTVTNGLIVSNISEAGVSLHDMVATSDENGGGSGLPVAADMTNADLYIIALGINDFQAHKDVATFKTQLTTAVQRMRASGTTGTFNNGIAANGDVFLMPIPQPNYATNPPDHILTPALSAYWTAMYEVADALDVALIDQSYRWKDYNSSISLFRDGIHPNKLGHADIGLSVGAALVSV